MADTVNVVCPACTSVNRVPIQKLEAGGKCGRCHEPLFTGKPLTLTETNFNKHLERNDLPVLVDFWAAWCGPCQSIAPVFARAAKELEPEVRLAKVDTEASQGIALRYGIRSIPTLILFKGGRELGRISGALDLNALLRWTRQHLV